MNNRVLEGDKIEDFLITSEIWQKGTLVSLSLGPKEVMYLLF
jgi:hypothetical protein